MCSESSFELQFWQQSHDSLEELFIECYDGSFRSSFALDNFPNIKTLRLEGCENPKSLWVSSNGLSFESLKSLSTMHISDCLGLTLFPSNISPLPSLTSFELENCKELKSLPEQMHNLFPSLESLDISMVVWSWSHFLYRDCPLVCVGSILRIPISSWLLEKTGICVGGL